MKMDSEVSNEISCENKEEQKGKEKEHTKSVNVEEKETYVLESKEVFQEKKIVITEEVITHKEIILEKIIKDNLEIVYQQVVKQTENSETLVSRITNKKTKKERIFQKKQNEIESIFKSVVNYFSRLMMFMIEHKIKKKYISALSFIKNHFIVSLEK